jgi:hypothetical protein
MSAFKAKRVAMAAAAIAVVATTVAADISGAGGLLLDPAI